jgi:hypothetical protein
VGSSACLVCALGFGVPERVGQLGPTADAEFAIGAAEVHLDRLLRDVQLLGDLSVGLAGGGQASEAQLARGEGVTACEPVTSGPSAAGAKLLARAVGERGGAAVACEVEPPRQVLPRLEAASGVAEERRPRGSVSEDTNTFLTQGECGGGDATRD